MTFLAWVVLAPVVAVAAGWMAGAIYYDVGRGRWHGRVLAIGWLVVVAVAFVVWRPAWEPLVAFAVVFGSFLVWWLNLSPQSNRDWRPELAVTASATVDGDRVVVRNVRHTEYRSVDDVTPRYDDREVCLSGLRGMDLLISWWGSPWMCHPFAIFEFDPPSGASSGSGGGGPVRIAFSLEVRSLKGQGFSVFRNLYRQNELICVAADERDLMRRRVLHEPGRRLYLYRLRLTPETVRTRFLEYIDLLNGLDREPAWYHALLTNCTTAIVRRYRTARPPLDWRVVVNGRMSEWLYELGYLEAGGLDFDELRDRSFINERVRTAAPEDDGPGGAAFGARVRAGLPGFPGVRS